MAFALIENQVVVEIIPEYALPVKDFYGEQFAEKCKEVGEEVRPGWAFKPELLIFVPPEEKEHEFNPDGTPIIGGK